MSTYLLPVYFKLVYNIIHKKIKKSYDRFP